MYLPDFTLVWQGEEIYWEHVGRLTDPVYVENWEAKRAWYDKFFPGKLRISYERSMEQIGTTLDVSTQADQIIRNL
jgi:hypothetical protein